MIAGLYSEISIICIIILLVIFCKIEANIDLRRSQKLLAVDILLFIIVTATDTAWALISAGYIKADLVFKYAVNVAYFCASATAAYIWLMYCIVHTGMAIAKNKAFVALSSFPALILIVLTTNSPFNKWIFYLGDSEEYLRGPLNFCTYTIIYGYIAVASVIALLGAFKKKNIIKRTLFISFASLMVCIITAGVLQIILPQYPIMALAITLPFFLVYLNLTDTLITMDGLTLMNNRNWFYIYHTENTPAQMANSGNYYLLIMDINSLLSINTRFGKENGDAAIKYVAKALKNTSYHFVTSTHMLSCRYGDDEFISIVHLLNYETNIEDVANYLRNEIRNLPREDKMPFELSACTGYAKYTADIEYIQDLVELADQNMYKAKQKL